ncbi:MAG: zinc ribbon domain-containing protein [Deltaproteobacteria bacterium]|nr:zinc ribbon domain-containing protein [Deltaproteobacteria bacterium]
MGFLFLAIILGVIPAAIAQKKGRSFVGWWIFGAALFIIALPASLIVKPLNVEPPDTLRKCPKCAEDIKRDALICKHCKSEVAPMAATADPVGINPRPMDIP